TRMRATAAGFIFNAPRLISAIAPLIAGTLIVSLGGYGKAATIIGLFYILGLIAVPFLPETKGKPLPEADTLSPAYGAEHRWKVRSMFLFSGSARALDRASHPGGDQ